MKKPSKSSSQTAGKAGQARPASAPLQFQKLLVPVDFSARSRQALRCAVGLAAPHRGQILLLHVVEPVFYPADLGYPSVSMTPVQDDYKSAALRKLSKLAEAEAAAGVKTLCKVRVGQPYREITKAAREFRADAIVISTHGHTGLTHALLGSTTERVVRHAACPVLTIRKPGRGG